MVSHITLHLTNVCNLFCRHCWVNASKNSDKSFIPLDKLKSIMETASQNGINSVKLTGGEPFLYPNVRELIYYLFEKKFDISIETNATLINKSDIQLLKDCNCYIATSLDGYNNDFHDWFRRCKGSFNKTLSSIRQMVKVGVPFQIIWSVCEENKCDIEKMIELCDEEHIDTIKINPVNIAGRMYKANEVTVLSAKERIKLHEKITELRDKYRNIYIAYPLPPAFMSAKEYVKYASECNFCSRCAILSNGDVGLCGADVTCPTSVYGNIYNTDFMKIIDSSVICKKHEMIMKNMGGVCSRCIHKSHCMGYCRANALFVSNSIYAPYFLCQEMYNDGLFPESRLKNQRIDHV